MASMCPMARLRAVVLACGVVASAASQAQGVSESSGACARLGAMG